VSPTPAEEIKELRATAVDWQEQFHQLKSAIEAHGLRVEYGNKGEPVVIGPLVGGRECPVHDEPNPGCHMCDAAVRRNSPAR
jgi:hypothetical protein